MKILFTSVLILFVAVSITSCSMDEIIEESDSLESKRSQFFTGIDPDPVNSQTLFPYMRANNVPCLNGTVAQSYSITVRRTALPPNSPELLTEVYITRAGVSTVVEVTIPANSRTSLPLTIMPDYVHVNSFGTAFPLSALGDGQASIRVGTVRVNGNLVNSGYVLESGSTSLNPICD